MIISLKSTHLFRWFLMLMIPIGLSAQNTQPNHTGAEQAIAFIKSLSEQQRKIAVFPFNEMNRMEWHFLPAYSVARTGLAVKDMDSSQKQLLYAVLKII